MTTPSPTRLQTSSVDQPLEDTKFLDIGKLLILYFHMITKLIHNNFYFIVFQHIKESVDFILYYLILFSYLITCIFDLYKEIILEVSLLFMCCLSTPDAHT